MPEQEFGAGGREVGLEFGAFLQTGHTCRGGQTGGIDIALPVGADYDAAFAIFPATAQDGVLQFGSHLGEDEGCGPAKRGVAGRVGAVAAQLLFIVESAGHMLVHPGKGTFAHILGFGLVHRLGGSHPGTAHEPEDGRGGLLADGEAEGFAEDSAHARDPIERFPAGLLSARGGAHGFAPQPLLEVVDEKRTACVGRSGKVDSGIGQRVGAEIRQGVDILPHGLETKEADENG